MYIADLEATTIDGQHLICLLYVLREIGGMNRRRDVCDYIRAERLLALNQGDTIPYPTQSEPAWMTDIAWARKTGVLFGIINDDEPNAWEINRQGTNALRGIFEGATSGEFDVKQCFLWSEKLRRTFVPSYLPSPADSPRPPRRRRSDSPHYYFEAMEELFKRGKGELVAAKLTLVLNRPIRCAPIACALAHKEWEDKGFQEMFNPLGDV
jgi:hypothetical protein